MATKWTTATSMGGWPGPSMRNMATRPLASKRASEQKRRCQMLICQDDNSPNHTDPNE